MHLKAIFLEKNNENKRKRQKGNNLKGLPAAWSRGCCRPSCCCNPHCTPCWERGKRSVKAHKLQAQWSYLVSHRALALRTWRPVADWSSLAFCPWMSVWPQDLPNSEQQQDTQTSLSHNPVFQFWCFRNQKLWNKQWLVAISICM